MFAKSTPAVMRALEAARAWAHRLGAERIEPEHLLRGLLDEPDGRAATLLTAAGLDLAAFTHRGVPAAGVAAADGLLPFSALAQRIANRAHELAVDAVPDRTVASEHVLLALLREDAGLRARLEGHGLVAIRLETELAAPPTPPLALEEPLHLADATEEIDTARLLDAGGNRAREALRVLEDYCRFVLDDAFLTGALKRLRHDLRAVLEELPALADLEARETRRDVGTELATAAEGLRASLQDVVRANFKRLQEALRSLEEYGKIRGPRLGAALERLRYQSYTLERALGLGAAARQRLSDARLYVLLTGANCAASLDWTIREVAAGGARIFQLREKHLSDRDLLARALQVRRWTRAVGALFIMNDRPDIARLAEADGVHVGQDELPVKEVRRVVGPHALIGVSTHTLEQVRQAVLDGASYLGVGPTFASHTKEFPDLAGLEFVRQATAETSLPIFVIGGVDLDNIEQVHAAGGRRVAVSRAICQAPDPRAAAAMFCRVLEDR